MSKVVNTANSLEKTEVSDRAIRTPLKKLEEGPSFEYSKDVIEPKILNQITQWKISKCLLSRRFRYHYQDDIPHPQACQMGILVQGHTRLLLHRLTRRSGTVHEWKMLVYMNG
ncbi:uncharacterized protein LOC113317196 isoform X2 [Papaver somniferum]|uniref:uncharacterized protein LOC113317196 isoform X2 n=1 Tax=Papaver somniferum TaxID=3469 RepID=UPI000E6FC49F|nr:uncharacterized protein LOC113317196 isoform X2 [Papaver somniferum]